MAVEDLNEGYERPVNDEDMEAEDPGAVAGEIVDPDVTPVDQMSETELEDAIGQDGQGPRPPDVFQNQDDDGEAPLTREEFQQTQETQPAQGTQPEYTQEQFSQLQQHYNQLYNWAQGQNNYLQQMQVQNQQNQAMAQQAPAQPVEDPEREITDLSPVEIDRLMSDERLSDSERNTLSTAKYLNPGLDKRDKKLIAEVRNLISGQIGESSRIQEAKQAQDRQAQNLMAQNPDLSDPNSTLRRTVERLWSEHPSLSQMPDGLQMAIQWAKEKSNVQNTIRSSAKEMKRAVTPMRAKQGGGAETTAKNPDRLTDKELVKEMHQAGIKFESFDVL